jgi:hypothetical protein
MKKSLALLTLAALLALSLAHQSHAEAKLAYFLVQVQNETFVLAIATERALRDAIDCLEGRKRLIPIGEIAIGDGGFNRGQSWHLKPETVRFAEVAMEVCDGRPSDVGNITARVFCPWSARIVQRLPDRP